MTKRFPLIIAAGATAALAFTGCAGPSLTSDATDESTQPSAQNSEATSDAGSASDTAAGGAGSGADAFDGSGSSDSGSSGSDSSGGDSGSSDSSGSDSSGGDAFDASGGSGSDSMGESSGGDSGSSGGSGSGYGDEAVGEEAPDGSGPAISLVNKRCNSGKLLTQWHIQDDSGVQKAVVYRYNEYNAAISSNAQWMGPETGDGNHWAATSNGSQNLKDLVKIVATDKAGNSSEATTEAPASC